MSSSWDDLDASSELEQAVAEALRAALGGRGYTVHHHGSEHSHATAGKPDIEVRADDRSLLIVVEVTKRRLSAADGEFVSTTDHLESAVKRGGYQHYGLLFVAPVVSPRMRKFYLDFNRRKRKSQVFMLDFAGLETILQELTSRDVDVYPGSRWATLFSPQVASLGTDDATARKIAAETLLPENLDLIEELADELRIAQTNDEARLKKQLKKLEDRLRDRGITGDNANRTLIYLVFMRLYEEKRTVKNSSPQYNRMTAEGFKIFRNDADALAKREHKNRFIDRLLSVIREEEPDLEAAGLLLSSDGKGISLHANVTDNLIDDLVFPILDEYNFIGTGIDVLGVIFETLAGRAEKDTRVGQFFTPQEVVDFCTALSEVAPRDNVLDPAVGTARFLIAAMKDMLARVDKNSSARVRGGIVSDIKQNRLHGVDIDQWVATIAKMNMYIHGDGKSNVVAGNGLTALDSGLLPRMGGGARNMIDVVLTNPPLGEVEVEVGAAEWARSAGADKIDDSEHASDRSESEFYEDLGTVPLLVVEEEKLAKKNERLAEIESELEAVEDSITNANELDADQFRRRKQLISNARRTRAQIKALEQLISSGEITKKPRVAKMKGGALFIGAISRYLTDDSENRRALPFEWRGGCAVVIVDEAILNTSSYSQTRAFIRENFFVKAVVSLGRQTFTHLAHTDAKTSILYLSKKPSTVTVQKEPVFYAHAELTGHDSNGDLVENHLPRILDAYRNFRDGVHACYRNGAPQLSEFDRLVSSTPQASYEWLAQYPGSGGDRLDYFFARRQEIERQLISGIGADSTVLLGELIVEGARVRPVPSRTSEYEFATIDRLAVEVKSKGRILTKYPAGYLWVLRQGQIVASGIDIVHGSIAVASAGVEGLVMSKEMFAYDVIDADSVLPEYIVMTVRSTNARSVIEGIVSGTSNRNRMVEPSYLLDVRVPKPPHIREQIKLAEALKTSMELRRAAHTALATAESLSERLWS